MLIKNEGRIIVLAPCFTHYIWMKLQSSVYVWHFCVYNLNIWLNMTEKMNVSFASPVTYAPALTTEEKSMIKQTQDEHRSFLKIPRRSVSSLHYYYYYFIQSRRVALSIYCVLWLKGWMKCSPRSRWCPYTLGVDLVLLLHSFWSRFHTSIL